MNGVKNTERTGVDMRVALSSRAKVLSSKSHEWTGLAAGAASAQAASSSGSKLKAAIKRSLRSIAHAMFLVLKPIVRPIAFRVRAYLFSELKIETQERHQRMVRDLEAHKQSQLEAMERLLNIHSTQVLQEVQAMRESLRRDVSSVVADASRQEKLAAQLEVLKEQAHASAYRVAVACGADEVLVRTTVGYVLCPASDPALISFLMESRGELERGTRMLIQKLLTPGDTFVDAGANIGMHTLAAAIAMSGRGRIVAFEPFPPTHALLRKSVWNNGFSEITETHQAAVSNRAGKQSLFLGSTSGHHSLYPLAQSVPGLPPVEVALVRIDDVLEAGARVNLLKIDVEGAELEAVEGAIATITSNTDIGLIVEFGISHLQRTGHSTAEWLQQFERLGFDFSVIDPETGALQDISTETLERSFSVNLFLARPGSESWNRARSSS